jgi:hypothetical protein
MIEIQSATFGGNVHRQHVAQPLNELFGMRSQYVSAANTKTSRPSSTSFMFHLFTVHFITTSTLLFQQNF